MSLDRSNPFSQPSPLPFGAPQFDKIKTEHFLPALEAGIKENLKEIEDIANQESEPTFENTMMAIEKSGQLLLRSIYIFDNYTNAWTSPEIRKIETEIAPKLAELSDAMYLNDKLFARIEKLYENRSGLNLDSESMRLLEETYKNFVRRGAKLNNAQKSEIKAINNELSTLGTKISQNILSEMKDSPIIVDNAEELSGLTPEQIQAAADAAKTRGLDGKYAIILVNTSIQPILKNLDNRDLRKRIHMASISRGIQDNANDNRALIARVFELKAKKAAILGYASPAALSIDTQTAKTVDAVNAMLTSMAPAARKSLEREAAELQALIKAEGKDFKLESWDWLYYAEKLRKQKYDFDETQLKPYFELNAVITKGVFYAAEKLYGLKFEEVKDLPVYDPDVRIWKVIDENGAEIGLFYGDYYARDNKRGGAWMSEYVNQSKLLNQKPVILNQINVPKPADGAPTLLTIDEVTTIFHEFGHALHGLLSNVTYPSLSGTNVARDFVEFPSQFNEVWAFWPEILDNYARHYQTGEKVPPQLIEKMKAAEKFNQGYMTTEYLAAALEDQMWFQYSVDNLPKITAENFETLEKENLEKVGLNLDLVPPRYRTGYFNHLFSSAYDAAYYSYIWSEVLDADAEQWFKTHGLTRENGQKYRDEVLSRGNTANPLDMYKNFTGRAPSSEYLMIRRGLKN